MSNYNSSYKTDVQKKHRLGQKHDLASFTIDSLILFLVMWQPWSFSMFLPFWGSYSLCIETQSVILKMKSTEQFFVVVLLIMLYKVVQTFESVDEILFSVSIQMIAIEQHFLVAQLIMLYKVVQTFESVHEILKCDHSNESF